MMMHLSTRGAVSYALVALIAAGTFQMLVSRRP